MITIPPISAVRGLAALAAMEEAEASRRLTEVLIAHTWCDDGSCKQPRDREFVAETKTTPGRFPLIVLHVPRCPADRELMTWLQPLDHRPIGFRPEETPQ